MAVCWFVCATDVLCLSQDMAAVEVISMIPQDAQCDTWVILLAVGSRIECTGCITQETLWACGGGLAATWVTAAIQWTVEGQTMEIEEPYCTVLISIWMPWLRTIWLGRYLTQNKNDVLSDGFRWLEKIRNNFVSKLCRAGTMNLTRAFRSCRPSCRPVEMSSAEFDRASSRNHQLELKHAFSLLPPFFYSLVN